MKPEEFTSVKDNLPDENEHIIVTNNLSAVNDHGQMSYVWLTTFLKKSDYVPDGDFITYAENGDTISNITHWKYV